MVELPRIEIIRDSLSLINPQAAVITAEYAACALDAIFVARFSETCIRESQDGDGKEFPETIHSTLVNCMVKFPPNAKFRAEKMEEALGNFLWKENDAGIERIKGLFRSAGSNSKWTLQWLAHKR